MRSHRWLLLLLASLPVWGQVNAARPRTARPTDFDIRDAAATTGRPSVDRRMAALETLRSLPGGATLRAVSNRYGLPKLLLRPGGVLTAPSNRGTVEIARDFLRTYRSVFPFRPDEVTQLRVAVQDAAADATFLTLQQTLDGIDVFNGQIKFTLTKAGEVVQVSAADVVPDLNLLTTPAVTAETAARAALQFASTPGAHTLALAPGEHLSAIPGTTGKPAFRNPAGNRFRPITVELAIVPMDADSARLAWRLFVETDSGTYEILVDAADGSLLFRHRLNRAAQARVWTQSPQVGSRQLLTLPAGWLPAAATVTTGNNADTYVDSDGNDQPDTDVITGLLNGRAYSAAQLFDFPYGDGLLSLDPRSYKPAAVTNLFYNLNIAHDFYYGLGFTEAAGNFQTDNFGRGGQGNDAILGEAQQGQEDNNAEFIGAPDGTSPLIRVGLFLRSSGPTADLDGDYDNQIVLHEYGHGVSDRLVGGATSTSCLINIQSGAMSEGWSDYFAISYSNNPVFGAYPAQNSTSGIRRHSYEAYPYTYEDIGNGSSGYEVHDDGEVWAAALWDLRKSLGQAVADRLVVNGLKSTPCNPSMTDARDAILTADQAGNAGANRAKIWQAFAKHGMGYSAAGVDVTLNGTIYNAAYDQPPDLQAALNPKITSQPIQGLAMGGPYAYQVAATNPASGTLSYQLNSGPAGMTVNPSTGFTQWTATFTGKRVKITVTDGKGGKVVHGFLLPVSTPLTAGVATVIDGQQNEVGYATIVVPPGAPLLQVTLRDGTGDADIALIDPSGVPAGASAQDGNTETLAVPSAAPGKWQIQVTGYLTFSGVSLTASLLTPQAVTPGATVQVAGRQGDSTYYDINVPAGTPILQVMLGGGSGDADLALFDPYGDFYGFSANDGNSEMVAVPSPAPGHWAAQVMGYLAYSGVSLTAKLVTPQLLPGNTVVNGLNGLAESETFYRIRVPVGATSLTVSTSGGTGDVDLFLKFGSPVTCQESITVFEACNFDQQSVHVGNADSISIASPPAGDYYIDVLGYEDFAGVTLTTSLAATPVLSVTPLTLSFSTVEGGTATPQNLAISGGSSSTYNWTANATATGGNWLTVSKTSGTGDATVQVTASAAGLARGTYTGTVTVTAPSLSFSGIAIPVTLAVAAGGSSNGNLAQGKPATQSSTLAGAAGAAASSAVDGVTDGSFGNGSVTATNADVNAWWQVDLGASTAIGSVAIWNRTDCCGTRLNSYWVFVSDTPFLASDTPATLQFRAGTWNSHQTSAPSPSATITAGTQGRYVRVQLDGTNYLSLAEVQVFAGVPAQPAFRVSSTHTGSFVQAQPSASYRLSVQNSGTASTSGAVSVTDTLPSGLTASAINGPGWGCSLANLTCSRSDVLVAGASYPPIIVTVSVASNALSPANNQVGVSGGGAASATGSDATTIIPAFTDISPTDVFLPAINLLRESGITTGCQASPPMYCSNDNIPESQMAVFVIRSVFGNDTFTYNQTPYFTDVPASYLYFPWIQKMQDLGIGLPCAANQYCPDTAVTRGQMSVLIIRSRFGTATPANYPATPYFTDVPPGHPYFPWIQKMKQLGITSGCTPTTYCPDDPVTRGQMAVFIMRGEFNQLLPDNSPLVVWISVADASAGQTVTVTLAGQNTNFSAATQVNAGAGITVSNVNVVNGTTLTAQFTVAAGATLGPRSITVTTGSEEATLPNGFRVQ